jgi:hypothetical protein
MWLFSGGSAAYRQKGRSGVPVRMNFFGSTTCLQLDLGRSSVVPVWLLFLCSVVGD